MKTTFSAVRFCLDFTGAIYFRLADGHGILKNDTESKFIGASTIPLHRAYNAHSYFMNQTQLALSLECPVLEKQNGQNSTSWRIFSTDIFDEEKDNISMPRHLLVENESSRYPTSSVFSSLPACPSGNSRRRLSVLLLLAARAKRLYRDEKHQRKEMVTDQVLSTEALFRCSLHFNGENFAPRGTSMKYNNSTLKKEKRHFAFFTDRNGVAMRPSILPLNNFPQRKRVNATVYQDPLKLSRYLPLHEKNSEDSLPKKCSRLGFKTQRSVEVRHQGVNNVVREEADDLNLIQLDSFAEEYGFMKAGTIQKTGNIIFEMIFSPVITPVLENVVNTVVETAAPMLAFMDEVAQVKGQAMAVSLGTILGSRVTANLTAVLPDLISWRVGHTLTKSLTVNLGGHLEEALPRRLLPKLQSVLTQVLGKSIPNQLNDVLPNLLSRSLTLSLTNALTDTLTHSLVPTLTEGLTHTKAQDFYCHQCFYQKKHCRLCHSSSNVKYVR
eukprot:g2893.t1